MNKGVLVGVIVVLAAVAATLGVQKMKSAKSEGAQTASSTNAAAPAAGSAAAPASAGQALDAKTIVGSVWGEAGKMEFHFDGGGKLRVVAGGNTINGNWSISGTNLTLTGGGRTIPCSISGNQILVGGAPANRIK